MNTLQVIGAVASAVTALLGGFFMVSWALKKTPDQVNQAIDQQVEKDKQDAENSGRPV